ncbi:hypothetical protein [Rhizobium sp. LCM 4573]|uniref:hypothetical protein n=1 Tax=Rhizobium sp. LCM 4573 TaxID=1848291 RepID=UPI0008DA0122|nr:hypothetical protein [Rhizobium sp. LCM 4573]OHV83663.1 hypothetical protein LCM4573_06035 [Rhizobium sp. LCM 4573]
MTIASKLDRGFWKADADGSEPDPFAMSPEQEARLLAEIAKREADEKAKQEAEAAEERRLAREWKIFVGLLSLLWFLGFVQLVAKSLR